MEYHFELAGLRTVLHTPMPITISDRLRPFQTTFSDHEDCVIKVCGRAALPVPSSCGVWYGPEYYDRQDGVLRIFHCPAPSEEAFAVTQLLDAHTVELLVLPAQLSYFTGSAGIFNRIGMETLLLQHHGLLLHASLIKYAGYTIAFAGPSGVGKSTQAEIWKTCLQADIINGDRSALRKTGDSWLAYGFPYAGTSGIYRQASAPLAAIVVLKQGKENCLRRMSAAEAFGSIYPELSIHRWDPVDTGKATDLCMELLGQIPVYFLECLPEESAALFLKKGLGL